MVKDLTTPSTFDIPCSIVIILSPSQTPTLPYPHTVSNNNHAAGLGMNGVI